jgi:hypothetical protein
VSAEDEVEADALLAKGDLRGELILVQLALEQGVADRVRRVGLLKREHELLSTHAKEWSKLDGLATKPVFRRGAVVDATFDIRTFIDHEREIFERAPHLDFVRLSGLEVDHSSALAPLLEHVFANPRFTGFEAVDVMLYDEEWGPVSIADQVLEWLIESDQLARLKSLVLHDVRDALATLTNTPNQLDTLKLDGELLTGQLEVGAASAVRPIHLGFGSMSLEAGGIRATLASSLTERVTDLELGRLVMQSALPYAFLPVTRQLRRLAGGTALRTDEFVVLANAPELANLEELVIHDSAIRRRAPDLEPFFEPEHLDSLRIFRIERGVDSVMARRFLQSPFAKRLDVIDFGASANVLSSYRAELEELWDGLILFG